MHLELFFFTLHINQTYTITSLAFQVYKIGFRTFLAQLVSILRVKLQNVVTRGKYIYIFNIWALLLKMYHFCVCDIFFSPSGYPINSIFQCQYVFIKCFWWSIFLLDMQQGALTHKYTWHLNRVVLLGHMTNKIHIHVLTPQ